VNGSDDLKKNLNAETRSRGENQRPTTEARRHGESRKSSDFSDHPITRSTDPALFKKAIRTLGAALCEIFDESAYDRFLLRTNAPRSVTSYRDFMRERDAAMLKKPRCC
jgi:hypothetical protein